MDGRGKVYLKNDRLVRGALTEKIYLFAAKSKVEPYNLFPEPMDLFARGICSALTEQQADAILGRIDELLIFSNNAPILKPILQEAVDALKLLPEYTSFVNTELAISSLQQQEQIAREKKQVEEAESIIAQINQLNSSIPVLSTNLANAVNRTSIYQVALAKIQAIGVPSDVEERKLGLNKVKQLWKQLSEISKALEIFNSVSFPTFHIGKPSIVKMNTDENKKYQNHLKRVFSQLNKGEWEEQINIEKSKLLKIQERIDSLNKRKNLSEQQRTKLTFLEEEKSQYEELINHVETLLKEVDTQESIIQVLLAAKSSVPLLEGRKLDYAMRQNSNYDSANAAEIANNLNQCFKSVLPTYKEPDYTSVAENKKTDRGLKRNASVPKDLGLRNNKEIPVTSTRQSLFQDKVFLPKPGLKAKREVMVELKKVGEKQKLFRQKRSVSANQIPKPETLQSPSIKKK